MLGPRSMRSNPGLRPLSDHNDYFSPQYDHQNSTKLLINRFEILGTPPLSDTPPLARAKSTRKQQYVYDHNRAENSLDTPNNHLESHKKEKSPIRQSIRNFLSVLKKSANGLSKKSDSKLGHHSNGEGFKDSTKSSPTDQIQQTFKPQLPRKKQIGSLLYLTHEQDSLAWTTCNVTLEENKIVLSSFTPNMDLYIHEIVLSHCTDIRSLSYVQLDADEAALLDAVPDSSKMKVFEILFQGRSREKFAAKTVRERAGWISAIWDAILPGQYKDPVPEQVVPSYRQSPETPSPIESPAPTPLPKACALPSPSYSDRSLPPLPPKATLPPLAILDNPLQIPSTPTKFAGRNSHPDALSPTDTPISPSIYPPTSRPTSTIGSPNSLFPLSPIPPNSTSPTGFSRPNSPSITNLSQLSVVRQRLAQIERNHSGLSVRNELTARASTPVSPSSCSARSRKEAVWSSPTASPQSDAVTLRGGNRSPTMPTGHVRKKAHRTETEHSLPEEVIITDPLDNILAQHGRSSAPAPSPQRDQNQGFEKASLTPLRQGLKKVSKDLSEVKGVLGGASGYPTVHRIVVGLDRRVQGNGETLSAIQDSLSNLGERVANVSAVQEQQTREQDLRQLSVQGGGIENVLRLLENIQSQLSSVFPSVVGKLTQIADTQEKEREKQQQQEQEQQTTYHNIGETPLDTEKRAEMETVLAKLEEISKLCSIQVQADGSREGEDGTKPSEYIDKILAFVDSESQIRGVLMQQQADSVRYLNELNTWLEAFVNDGTSQIQGLATNVDRLCKDLGCNTQQQQSGTPCPLEDDSPTLLTDIRQLVLETQARDQNFASLQIAVHGLLDVLNTSQAQKGTDSQVIAGLIDRQRQDQETLLRAFTNEISGEIKGERLRFVEAMKEATAINVQIHVEQFKQELSREVMSMTEEVGRLHREKQVVENQISELFAFYTRQKPAFPLETNGPPARQQPLLPPSPPERARANIPRSYRRPLPCP